tara:strand:+ start:6197 stop:7048 length:852 start_codon:yes stop_codon:yes gene_type:complete
LKKYIRIIPRLDIKGNNLVKGIHLEGLRVLGTPEDFALYYYNNGADELIYQDCVASLYKRNSLLETVRRTAKSIFIPLTVGGGLRTLDDIYNVLRAGADKVSINTGAINNPDFIDSAANTFGSSTIVVAIESIRQSDGIYKAFTDNGREYTGKEVLEWAKEAESRGAGEILLTSIDNEGTGKGFDINLVELLMSTMQIPVIIHGGASNSDHVYKVINDFQVDAVAIASMFHYSAIGDGDFIRSTIQEGNTQFLNEKRSFKSFKNISIKDLKEKLKQRDVPIRE